MAQEKTRKPALKLSDPRLFHLGVLLLLVLGFLMSLIKVFGITDPWDQSHPFHLYEIHGSWLLVISTILHVIAIALVLHHVFGFIRSPQINLCVGIICGVIALLLIIKWIAGFRYNEGEHYALHLTAGGWIMLIVELGAAGLSYFCYRKEYKAG